MLTHQKVVEFVLWFHFLLKSQMSTRRDMLQPMILVIHFCFRMGNHQNLPHNHSSLGLLKSSCNTHLRGTLFTTRSSLYLYHATTAIRYHFGCWHVLFLWKPYVTRNNWHWTRTHKTVRILSVLDRFWQQSQEDVMTYKDSLNAIPCSSLETQTRSHEMQTNWLTLSQKVIRTKCCTHDWKRSMTVAYIRTRQQKAWSPVTNRRYFRRHGCPWKCLRKWGTHSSLPC